MSHTKAHQLERTIVVVGATGIQGSGVVQALLSDGRKSPWFVRALTQDPDSSKAEALLSKYQTDDKRLSLVSGHVYDEASLRAAFAGAYGVFAMTSERHPNKVITEEADMQHELEAGRNIISAAKHCGIRHLVYSSLPDVVKASKGQFQRIHHMDNKYTIEQMARKDLDGFTALIPGFFYNNLAWSQYCRVRDDGVVRFCMPLPGNQPVQWTDPGHDMGMFSSRIFDLGIEKTEGKTYLALGPQITPTGMAEVFTKVTGKQAVHEPISFEEFGELSSALVGPAFKEDAIEMMQWAAIAPSNRACYGALEAETEKVNEELGVVASTFEEWLRRSGWTGP